MRKVILTYKVERKQINPLFLSEEKENGGIWEVISTTDLYVKVKSCESSTGYWECSRMNWSFDDVIVLPKELFEI